jgi:radical SAM superfamily enzyme YgiQ (UPF0313 family)
MNSSQEVDPLISDGVNYKKFRIYLIKPSKYDDDGYVIRYWKGVLPSNTLACLYALTKDVQDRRILGEDLEWEIVLIDDTVQKPPYETIIRQAKEPDTKTIVILVGVQSNQFPRAEDIALKLRKCGVDILIGGFHVSGAIATLPELPAELQEMRDAGVTLVAGEAEGGHWEMMLHDALEGKLQPVYNFLGDLPDISDSPVPEVPPGTMSRYALSHFGTLDCGRGCPFGCSFCTVINVQGRKMRYRNVDKILTKIRENYHKHKITDYFFTDDNFCRNKNWEAITDGLIHMREKEGIPVKFMMQIDTQSHKVPGFVEKTARAGCIQAFIGMESLNEENLVAVQKTQNKTGQFRELVDAFHRAGIATHLAYIIGFQFDTVESVKRDVDRLVSLEAAQASFFMMTPLPGSMDYKAFLEKGMVRDVDLNNYDTFHETHRHPLMDPGQWLGAYEDAWRTFYDTENMKRIIRNAPKDRAWGIFFNLIWYKNGVNVEGGHPMIHGFIRLKGRHERRLSFPVEGRWEYFRRRAKDVRLLLGGWLKLALELVEVWLATRSVPESEEKIARVLSKTPHTHWRDLSLKDLKKVFREAGVPVPSDLQLWLSKANIFWDNHACTREPFARFWKETGGKFRHGKWYKVNYLKMVILAVQEAALIVSFIRALLKSGHF